MALRLVVLVVLACLAGSPSGFAGQPTPYAVPRTEHGHPDFQGVWATAFLTLLERPPGVEMLVATPEQAEAVGAMMRKNTPAVVDPDFQLHDIRRLARVKGQYRTSISSTLKMAGCRSRRQASILPGSWRNATSRTTTRSSGRWSTGALKISGMRQCGRSRYSFRG